MSYNEGLSYWKPQESRSEQNYKLCLPDLFLNVLSESGPVCVDGVQQEVLTQR